MEIFGSTVAVRRFVSDTRLMRSSFVRLRSELWRAHAFPLLRRRRASVRSGTGRVRSDARDGRTTPVFKRSVRAAVHIRRERRGCDGRGADRGEDDADEAEERGRAR